MNAKTYVAEYSTTDGQMWANAGEHETIGQARHALRGYRKAGHLIRIIECDANAPMDTIRNLIKNGHARLV